MTIVALVHSVEPGIQRENQDTPKAPGSALPARRGFARRAALATAILGLLLSGALPSAVADPDDDGMPSRQEVEDARERVDDTKRAVRDIRAELAAANARLEELEQAAIRAERDYHAARWRLQQAREDAQAAERKARRAGRRVHRQSENIGKLVAQTYQSGSNVGRLSMYLLSSDATTLGRRYAAYEGASDAMQSGIDRFRAADSLAQVFRREAAKAVKEAEAAKAAAERARQAAESSVAAQQAAVRHTTQQRDQLMTELAKAQDISVELAEQRQAALERREERRRQRAAARAFERAQQRAEEEQARERAQRAEEQAQSTPERSDDGDDAGTRETAKPKPVERSQPRQSQDPREIAWSMMAAYGWNSQTEFGCLDALYISESNWDPQAVNPSSGAYGIPQALPAEKMATAGSDWRTNPATQLEWGLAYIEERYGTPCSAWSFKQGHNWY